MLNVKQAKRKLILRIIVVVLTLTCLVSAITFAVVKRPFNNNFELVDQLGGNIFPSAILSVATTDTQIIQPIEGGESVGNAKSVFAIKLHNHKAGTEVHIELAETPFYARSVSTFVLTKPDADYIVYPDVLWRYDALRNNEQAEPISVAAQVEVNGKSWGQRVRTFSVRSINECLLGYYKPLPNGKRRYVSTRLFYAAYVNEENPLIDKILREALNTRIVRRFVGYQGSEQMVDKQVYALWYVLQKRAFRYSSVSYSSLSSNVVYSQRVRTFEDALSSSQINCVDGSVLFASLLRAINITPVLVQMPGHMFVGYYTNSAKKHLTFLETTMIGDVDLDDYFPDEKLDSMSTKKSQSEMSRITFEKSKEYAHREYERVKANVLANKPTYLFVEINKNVRRSVQSIGK
mgnify:CR=1 FL=1